MKLYYYINNIKVRENEFMEMLKIDLEKHCQKYEIKCSLDEMIKELRNYTNSYSFLIGSNYYGIDEELFNYFQLDYRSQEKAYFSVKDEYMKTEFSSFLKPLLYKKLESLYDYQDKAILEDLEDFLEVFECKFYENGLYAGNVKDKESLCRKPIKKGSDEK